MSTISSPLLSTSSHAALSTVASQVPTMTTDQLVQCVESIEHPNKDRFLAFLNFFHVTGDTFVNFTAEQLAQLAEDDRHVVDCLLVLQGKDTGNSPPQQRRRIIRADEVFSQRSPSPTEGFLSVQIGDEVSFMDEHWGISSLGSPQGPQSVHFETPYDSSVQEALRQNVASPSFDSAMLRDSVDVDRTSLAAAIDSGSASPEGEQTGSTSVALLFAPSTIPPTMEEDGLSQLSFRATSDLSSFGPLGASDHNQYPNSDYDDRVHIASHIVEAEPGATEESIEFEDESINEFDDSATQGSAGDLGSRHGSDWMAPEEETDIVLYPDPCMGNYAVDADNHQHDARSETDTQALNNGRDMDRTDKLSFSESYGSEFEMGFRGEETRSGLVSQQVDGLSHDQSGSIASIVDSLIPEHLAEGDTNSSYPDLTSNQSLPESESHVLYSDRERDDVTSIQSSNIDSGASALHDHEPHSLPYILSLDSDDFNVDWSFLHQPESCIPDAPVQLPKIHIEPLAESIDRGLVTSDIHGHQRSSFCRRFQSRSLGNQYDGRTFFSQRDTQAVRPIQKRKHCDIAIQTEKSRADRRAEKLETRVNQLEHEIQTLRAESAKERESFHFGRAFLSFRGPNPLEMDYFSAGGWSQGYDRV